MDRNKHWRRCAPLRPVVRSVATAGVLSALVGGLGAFEPVTPTALAQAALPASLYTCNGGVAETYTVPPGITRVFVSAAGGAGAADSGNSARGGLGARVEGIVAVQPGDQLRVVAGCTARGRTGGLGGDGLEEFIKGGDGGVSFAYCDGGGGGGPSGVLVGRQGGSDVFVAGAGGGASGCAGLSDGHTGHNAGLTTANPQETQNGGRGLGSTGGGGGGGGGGGNRGGAGGGGGSRLYQPGSAGDGGSSRVPYFATNTKVVSGGGPSGDGFVLVAPLSGVRPAPIVSYYSCQGGAAQSYTVPANVNSLQALVNGAGGSDSNVSGARGGGGASVQATLPVSPGQALSVVVGCQGDGFSGGRGYRNGGDTGSISSASDATASGRGGGGGSALLNTATQALVVAGGGGGAGGSGSSGSPGNGGNGSTAGDPGTNASGSRAGSGGAGGVFSGGNGGDGHGTSCPQAASGGGGGGGFKGGEGGFAGLCINGTDQPGSSGGGGGGASLIPAGGSIVGGAAHGSGLVILVAYVPSVPTAPGFLRATGGPTQASVSFLPPTDDGGLPITSYTVTSIPEGHIATGTASPITVTGLTTRTPYQFTVHATNALGNSAESELSNVVTTIFAPDPPRIVSLTGGDGQATVAFNPPASDGGRPITGYTAIARPGAGTLSGPGISVSSTSSPITIRGLTDGATYTVSVLATNEVGNGGEALAGAVVPFGLPGAPTGATATLTPGGISVSFAPPAVTGGAPIDSYTVTSTDGRINASGSASPIVVTGLSNGTSYAFTMHATTRAGSGPESAPTNAVTWVSSTALSPPMFPQAFPGVQQATVIFSPPLDNGGSPVLSYTVTSNPGGLTATGPASPIVVTGLTNGVSYTFTVIATNANGNSQPSTVSNAVTPRPATIPSAPPAPVATARNQGALVSITPPPSDGGSPITSYTVTSSPDGVTVASSTSPITMTGLTNGVSYTFTVVATNAVGSSQSSPASNAITPSASLAPANDNFANAQVITGDTGTVTGTNVNATTEAGEPGPAGASVWYVWTVTHGGVVQIDACGSSFTPSVVAYAGSAVTALTPLASGPVGVFCNGGFISGIQVSLPPNGGTIYIAVDGGTPSSPVEGSITLHWGQGG